MNAAYREELETSSNPRRRRSVGCRAAIAAVWTAAVMAGCSSSDDPTFNPSGGGAGSGGDGFGGMAGHAGAGGIGGSGNGGVGVGGTAGMGTAGMTAGGTAGMGTAGMGTAGMGNVGGSAPVGGAAGSSGGGSAGTGAGGETATSSDDSTSGDATTTDTSGDQGTSIEEGDAGTGDEATDTSEVDVTLPDAGLDGESDAGVDASEPDPDPINLLSDPSFESGSQGWSAAHGGTLSRASTQARTGSFSLFMSDRTEDYQGLFYDLLGTVTEGVTYAVTVYVRLDNAAVGTVTLSTRRVCDGGAAVFANLESVAASDGAWVELSAEFTAAPCADLSEFFFYVEGPDAGVNFYVDDVSLVVAD